MRVLVWHLSGGMLNRMGLTDILQRCDVLNNLHSPMPALVIVLEEYEHIFDFSFVAAETFTTIEVPNDVMEYDNVVFC